jgi:hypothetical protein
MLVFAAHVYLKCAATAGSRVDHNPCFSHFLGWAVITALVQEIETHDSSGAGAIRMSDQFQGYWLFFDSRSSRRQRTGRGSSITIRVEERASARRPL